MVPILSRRWLSWPDSLYSAMTLLNPSTAAHGAAVFSVKVNLAQTEKLGS
jgi:hypothetical protein